MKKSQSKDDGILDGFSSEEEVCHEEINVQVKKPTEIDETHREQVKLKLPPPQEIKKKAYSLNPDMATGWAPKNDLPVPIPLIFDSRRTDNIVKRFIEKKNQKMRLIYLGPRYQSTFFSWYNKPFDFPYTHIQAPHNMKFSKRAFCGQHWQAQECLVFDSFFQSGNLDCAIQVGQRQYDLYMRVDSNTRGHLQWFNFKITNLQKLQKYRLNICNFQKKSTLYARGQKPYIFSKKKFQRQKIGWHQGGFSISYEPKPGKSAKVLTTDYNCLYKLSFQYYTEYEQDQIQFTYCIPYMYSQLGEYLKKLTKKCAGQGFLTINKLCNSLGGLQVPLVIVHDKNENEDQEVRVPKKCVVVSGRVHPGESNGSYMMEGFLDFLCGDSKEAKRLRSDFIFKIAPMLNPDGVCMGNYRTGVSGKDFNREYHNPDKSIFPEVYAFKNLVIQNKTQFRENLLMFLDFHGHSTKKNVFMYGPQFPIIQKHYYQCRVYPKLLANHTSMFRYYSCSFRISECKVTTARAVLLKRLMIPFSYTIEASNGFFYDAQQLKDVAFNDDSWKKMGEKIGTSLAEYAELVMYSQRLKYEKMRLRKTKKQGVKRKNNNSPSKQKSNFSYGSQIVILSGVQDEKIKNLFAEIKKIQSEREINKNDEDQISEGSSDGEGETDDLAQQKMKALYQVIKDKKESDHDDLHNSYHSCCEEDLQKKNSVKKFSEDFHPANCTWQFPPEKQKQKEEQLFKPNASLGGQLTNRNKNSFTNYLGSEKKEKMAARIINFSFIGGDRRTEYKSVSQKHTNSTSINDNLPIPVIKKSKKDAFNISNYNNCVLDLSSDGINRAAYVSMLRDRILTKEPFGKTTGAFVSNNPRKVSARLQEFRQKKSALGQYQL